tara:strand:+ start:7 stop:696 length:690 start_codon:yes stop_codon:yes gene_type:complete
MATETIRFDVKQILGRVDAIEKQLIPRAARLAANRAAFDATVALKQEAQNKFMQTVPYTLRSFKYDKPEQINNKTLRASVFISQKRDRGNAASDYLAPQIYGGSAFRTRFQRGLENAETYLGKDSTPILRKDKLMIPVGKMRANTYSVIMKQMRGESKPKNNRYFYMGEKSVRKSGYKKGIYLRKNGKIHLRMKEISMPSFTGKFNFFKVAEDTVRESFNRNLLKEIGR